MENKITNIVRAAILIALGVLVAIYGGGAVADVYFAIVFLIVGIASLALAGVGIAKKLPFLAGYVLLGTVLITVSIALFTEQLTFSVFITLLVFVILGLGVGLILTGIYYVAKKSLPLGIAQIVAGAVCVLLSTLYLAIPEFRTAFWVIVGIVIAVLGVFLLVTTLINKKAKK